MKTNRKLNKWTALLLMVLLLAGIGIQACAENANQVTIDGVTYDFPCRLSEFLNNGWTISSEDQEWTDTASDQYVDFTLTAGGTVPAHYAGSYILEKNGKYIFTMSPSTSGKKQASRLVISSITLIVTSAPSVRFMGRDFSRINDSTVYEMFEPISLYMEDCGAGEWEAQFENSDIMMHFVTDSAGWYQIDIGVTFAYDY